MRRQVPFFFAAAPHTRRTESTPSRRDQGVDDRATDRIAHVRPDGASDGDPARGGTARGARDLQRSVSFRPPSAPRRAIDGGEGDEPLRAARERDLDAAGLRDLERAPWQHIGNVHAVPNRPDRPPCIAKPLQNRRSGHNGHHVHPASKVESLVGRKARGSSSLPGRTATESEPVSLVNEFGPPVRSRPRSNV